MKTSIGLCGATGKTPELQIGQVKTVDYTQKASVEITGTRENPILNFNIPKGKDGAKLIVREYFNGDIQILNNLNELPQDTNSDSYGKTVMSVNGIKQLLEKINDVLTKANANTNAIGSLTSTVQGNKSDIETKLNNFKSDTDTKVQRINQSISDLEQTIETKLNEELTKQVKALQDENKKLNDMLFENSLKESFEGSTSSISDTSNGVAVIETIKGQTIVTDAPSEENPNYKNIESVGDKENNKISILSHNKNLINKQSINYNVQNARFAEHSCNIITNGNNFRYTYKYEILSIDKEQDSFASNLAGSLLNSPNKLNADIDASIIDQKLYTGAKGTVSIYVNNAQNKYSIMSLRAIRTGEPVNMKYRIYDIGFYFDDKVDNGYIPYKEDKKEISLPIEGGLKSLPNGVADTIEQREDGFYLVQRIGKVILDGDVSEQWYADNRVLENTLIFDKPFTSKLNYRGDSMIANKFNLTQGSTVNDVENIEIFSNTLYVRVNKSRLSTLDLNGFLKWLNDEPLILYYPLATPVETKIDIDTLNLKTFKDLTYVTTENSIKPVLKGQATKDITTVIKNLQSKGAN